MAGTGTAGDPPFEGTTIFLQTVAYGRLAGEGAVATDEAGAGAGTTAV